MAKKRTKKEFREYLNKLYGCDQTGKGENKRYKPNKRGYGDYLYSQDRIMFDIAYQEWLEKEEK